MALATAEKTVNENDIEVFTRTPTQIRGETCEACGSGAVPARYAATKEDKDLYFCAHHIRKFNTNLVNQGFVVFPEDISYTAGVLD